MQKLLFFSILICLVLTVHARPVSEAEARRLAQSFLQQRGKTADNTAASRRVARAPRHAISPLVVTRWDQGTPYNTLCPIIDGTQCVTGCVATSMAQVMYHHRWPEGKTANIPAYTASTSSRPLNRKRLLSNLTAHLRLIE